jgi:hypothetical protein
MTGSYDPTDLPGLVAESDAAGELCGALTYRQSPSGFEVVTLNSLVEDRGIGSTLLAEARRRAGAAGLRMFLVTSNENMRAMGFYQRRGMDMVALHRDFAVAVARSKPAALNAANDGIAFRHGIEFEYPAPTGPGRGQ